MRDHPDAQTYLAATEAFRAADLATLATTLHEDVVWRVPGGSWLAGDVKGKNTLLEYLKNIQIQTGGTFVLEGKFVSATDDHVLAVQVMGATLEGKQRLFDVYSVMRFEDGLQRQRTFHIADLEEWDDFFG